MNSLQTANKDITLVPPDVERDAPLGVQWLAGEAGRVTLKLMGNTDEQNKPSTLEEEKERVRDFIENTNQLNWMIQFKNSIVGSIWVDLVASEHLPAPSIHLMIGDPNARKHGIGTDACIAVIKYLKNTEEYRTIYSRHLVINIGSAKLLNILGFENNGSTYSDSDGLVWQNVELHV